MTLPQALAAVVDIQHSHRELLRVVDGLTAEQWERGVPYGEWTVKDLVAHCIGDLSPSGPGLIVAGVLTPEFIEETSRTFDTRSRNQDLVDERRRYTPADLRQLLFEAHDASIAATLRLDESHLPVLDYDVPMGPEYTIKVLDWLWFGYHDRQHTDDIRRALAIDWTPHHRPHLPELTEVIRLMVRYRQGLLRAVYSVADQAWDEPAHGEGGWSYRGVLAHLATNDLRPQARLLAIMGEGNEQELESLQHTDEWNEDHVVKRAGKSVSELVDEMLANRNDLLAIIARLEPPHLAETITFSSGDTVTLADYLGHIGRHDSYHAGQLVPASRARRHPR
jgi:uncharacterized damage-inducible protein DinB